MSILKNGSLSSEAVVIGSGVGGAITSAMLTEAGLDVILLEEGSHLPLDSAPHFTLEEISQKYRGRGLTVGLGKAKVAYVEGRCVGGGSEINRGLYHRISSEVLEAWDREYHVKVLSKDELTPHYEACEKDLCISHLRVSPPPVSLKLNEGAQKLGWQSIEVPRLVQYYVDESGTEKTRKQSMTETFIPRFLSAGGMLLSNMWVRRIYRQRGRWRVQAENVYYHHQNLEITADTIFIACGAIQTPALLGRSGFKLSAFNTLRFHPMIKVVARFPEEVNFPGMPDPVHQVKEFDPRFSMGCSVSSRPTLALAMADHPEHLKEVDRYGRCMGLYYAQTTGGNGSVRVLPGFRDPLVSVNIPKQELSVLSEALRRLCECLFAAGAVAIYPGISGFPTLQSEKDLISLPEILPAKLTNLSTLHLFSSCPMGENRLRCSVNSFGKVYGTDQLYIADASLLCGPTVVNPQGTVMAIAHRNVMEFLHSRGQRLSIKSAQQLETWKAPMQSYLNFEEETELADRQSDASIHS